MRRKIERFKAALKSDSHKVGLKTFTQCTIARIDPQVETRRS